MFCICSWVLSRRDKFCGETIPILPFGFAQGKLGSRQAFVTGPTGESVVWRRISGCAVGRVGASGGGLGGIWRIPLPRFFAELRMTGRWGQGDGQKRRPRPRWPRPYRTHASRRRVTSACGCQRAWVSLTVASMMVIPPSTTRVAPVINDAWSEARKRTGIAISSTLPIRLSREAVVSHLI